MRVCECMCECVCKCMCVCVLIKRCVSALWRSCFEVVAVCERVRVYVHVCVCLSDVV